MVQFLGLISVPEYTGHNPLSTRNKEDFPQPLGPVMRRWDPGDTCILRLGTTTSPFGVTIGTSFSSILPSVLSNITPVKQQKFTNFTPVGRH